MLTTAVLSALPSYVMGAIELTKTTIHKIDRSWKSMFWKGGVECKGGDGQVAWSRACCPREDGGLGIKDLHTQNMCLLLKLLHKLMTGTDTPWVRWIMQEYEPFKTGFRTSVRYTNPWNTLARLMPLYQAITSVDVGDGTRTFFWYDDWTSLGPLHQAFSGGLLTLH
ncbi:hypothetical protein PR202_gb27526 [Eleusine coracana subsp. coracana]|uniref:Uncharacterized protein n=1 Tax=Eleusine coracana subsp. coracana TaxID=191504 RepID=A0AAV5FUS5_ELECO|nr:hypothetical protein PR202_gb27526 [Eleusine coracana subsp. coracana]